MGNWGACRLVTFVVLLGAFGALTSAEDRLRPQYHFLPPANWMNDANGIYWKGHYHLFYLYNPEAPIWRLEKQWGHAVSEDLVHWKYMSSALSPAAEGPETHCCQSGCVVDHGGIPTAVYACGWPSIAHSLCLATSRDDLKTWERYSGNPIIASPPRGLDVTGFRDPFVWREGNSWYMLVGSGIKNMGGSALLYRSRDLRRWEYLHPLFLGNQSAGQMWEVPSIFRLGNRSIFLYSPVPESRFSAYFVGSYLNHRFRPDRQGKIDLGDYFYAASTFADGNGRRVLLGWIKEGRSQQLTLEAGWAGLLSLPRVISMGPDGLLRMEPPTELRGLRGEARHFGPANIGPETLNALGKVQGDSLEILAEFLPGDAKEFGIKLRRSSNGEEETLVGYDRIAKQLYIDTARSSNNPATDRKRAGGILGLAKGQSLKLDIFLDRSVVEVFANRQACITGRIYPSLSNSLGVDLFATGGSTRLISLDLWEMKPIW